jgi:hypothetical protein
MRFVSRLNHAQRTALRPRPYFAVPAYAAAVPSEPVAADAATSVAPAPVAVTGRENDDVAVAL